MADIRCSHCGENNPDFLDVCQFCQSPLKSESMLHAGEAPSAKDTDELEPILPEWLQDARQQSRDSEDADTFSPETRPRVQKDEPVDLLAGLASQDDSDDDDDVPDWLASINPVDDKKSTLPSASNDEEEPSDFFAQFSQTESQSTDTEKDKPESGEEDPAKLFGGMESQEADQTDELTDWLSQTTDEASEPVTFGEIASDEIETANLMDNLGETTEPIKDEPPAEKEPEDLSWLHDLESASRQADELPSSEKETEFNIPAVPSESSGEDLSWLDNLGGTRAPAADTPAQPESDSDDLGWLNELGGTPATGAEEPAPEKSESSQEGLSWLNDVGGTPVSDAEESAPSPQPGSSQDELGWMKNLGETQESETEVPVSSTSPEGDLDWMKNLGDTQTPETDDSVPQAASSDSDLDWMKNLGDAPVSDTEENVSVSSSEGDLGWMKNLEEDTPSTEPETSTSPFTPPGTAPLDENAGKDSTPDWLKSAMEEPSMPAPGDLSMDWFTEPEKETESDTESDIQHDETIDSSLSEPDSDATSLDLPFDGSFANSQQDVDAMFNIDIPDLDQESEDQGTSQRESADITADGDTSLAPVDLPSWVQDMRPVDSALTGSSTVDYDDQEPESEGPLAGFTGVIPSAPIGSSLRPKAFSMKLQVTDEQQAGAALMEQIIASESAAHAPASPTEVASQRTLRWILSAVLVGIISFMLLIGSQSFSIIGASQVSDLVGTIPESSPVLIVVDYEPAVAGELAAAAGPVLDQLASSRQSTFTFLAMSPNGSAMVEHLMLSTNVSGPVDNRGLGYQSGVQYFNVGFLPGGSTGVLGFIDDPISVKPSLANVNDFSDFEAVIVITDNADSGRVWVEQLEVAKQARPEILFKPLIVVSSAQAGPMLEPYQSSGQVNVLVSGLSDAAKYEFVNQTRPGIARAYWDSFGIGLMIAILAIVLGSVWNIFTGIRERRAEAEQG